MAYNHENRVNSFTDKELCESVLRGMKQTHKDWKFGECNDDNDINNWPALKQA